MNTMFITPCVNIVIETLYNACFSPFPPMKPLKGKLLWNSQISFSLR